MGGFGKACPLDEDEQDVYATELLGSPSTDRDDTQALEVDQNVGF